MRKPVSRRRPVLSAGLCLGLAWLLAGATLRGDVVLTNYTAAKPLKIMPSGDSITDDCSINGAWRLYLEPMLETNGYAFTNVGRWTSSVAAAFTKVHHEGICGAVIAYPGMFSYHGYPALSNYAQKTLMDALTNATPDLFLIDLGVNDMGYGRDPYYVATNDMAALLDLLFAKVPSANIIVGKPTTITYANVYSPPYLTYGTNMPIFCAALQALVNARRAQGQNVFTADLFSAVNGTTMLLSDGTHPNPTGLNAMANEWLFRIAALTARPDRVVTPFIAAGSTWNYSDQGLDLGTNWAQPLYDTSGWSQGPARFGYNLPGLSTTVSYGPTVTNKYMATYFRRTFVVPANVHYTNLALRLNRVCGAAVWLNGRELCRMNMPSGPLTYQSPASTAVAGDYQYTYYPTNVAIPSLPAGTNCLAVEVHLVSAPYAHLSFDLELFGMGQNSPQLSASLAETNFSVTWPATNNAGFILTSGTNLSQPGAWLPLGGPYVLRNGVFAYSEPVMESQPANFYALRYAGLPVTGPNLGWVLHSNTLGFYWATGFAGFNLETSTGLLPNSSWQVVGGPYFLSNDSFGVSLPQNPGPQQFFRLRKPVP
jgi:lysophospholipase L1-like esterase